MSLLKRTTCLLLGHNQTRQRYPPDKPGQDAPEGWFLKCARCGKVDEGAGLPPGPMAAGF